MSDVKKLYNTLLSHGYTSEDLGDENTFTTAMSDAANRKELYDGARANGLDLGDYDEYEKRLTQTSNNTIQATTPEPPKAEEVKPIQVPSAPTLKYGEVEDKEYLTPAETTRKMMAQGVKQRQQVADMTANVQQALDDRGVELDAQARQSSQSFIPRGTAGSVAGYDAGRMYDSEYRDYAAAKEALDNAQKLMDEAVANGKEENNKGLFNGFFKSAKRGVEDLDLNNFTFGLKDASENEALLKALDAADEGNATPSQQALLDAAALQMATQADYGSSVGRGYKAGQAAGEAVPFMIEMAINPLSKVGKGIANRVARHYIKKYLGNEVLEQAAKKGTKYALTRIAPRVAQVAGDLAGSAGMAATTGAVNVTADAFKRMQGDVLYSTAEDGTVKYDGHTEGDDAATAFAKAYANSTLQNYSEMFGGYFAPLSRAAGKGLTKGLSKVGLDKINSLLNEVSASDLARVVTDFEQYANWNGTMGEFAEEITGGVLNSIFVGDQTLGEVFDKENLTQTLVDVAFLGGIMSSAKVIDYPAYKYQAQSDIKKAKIPFDKLFDSEDKAIMETAFNDSDARVAGNKLREIINSDDYTEEQKMAAANYAKTIQAYKGAKLMDDKRFADPYIPQEEKNVEEAYDKGRAAETPAEMTDANNMYEIKAAEIRDRFGLGEDADEETINTLFNGDAFQAAMKLREDDVELSDLILDYTYAKATRDGIIDAARDRISEESAQAEAIIDYRKNKTDGMIHPATLKTKDANGNDKQVYVVSGNIVTFEDGNINTQESDNDIIIQDAVTGKPEFATAKDLLRAEQALDPEVEKQNVRNTIADTIATEVENKMNNVLPFNVGDAYNIIGADGAEHSVQVMADNGDGSVMTSIDNAEAVAMPKSEIQQLSNEYNINRARLANEAQKEAKQSEKMMQESQNVEPTQEDVAEVAPAQRIVPTTKDGKPDFNAMDAEMFVEEYASRYGEDSAAKIARKNISVEREKIAKIDKKIDDVTDPNQMDALFEQKAASEAVVSRYSEILERLGLSEDVNETEDDQKSRLRNEAGNRIASLFPDGMPNVESFILADIATGNRIRWSDKVTNGVVTSRGLGAELGLSDTERRRRLPLIGKDAMTPEEYAESLRERLDAVGIRYDESSLRDAVLGVYQSVDSRKGAWDALENMSKKMQEPQTDMDWEDMQQQMAYNKAMQAEYESQPQGAETELPDLETYEEEVPISEGENRKEVYNRQTTAKQPAEVVETSQSVESNGTQTPSSLIDVSTPKSSESKDTTSEPQKQEVDEKILQEEQKVNVNPTDGQKEAGNYKKGHVVVDGFNITIEQPKGSVRSGVDADGKEWSITMNNTYGYIRGTEGVDGDHIDVFLSDNLDNWEGEVFVVDQINTDGSFDEHKVMYGFNSIEEAQQAYLSNYSEGWQGLGAITGVSKDEFKKWIESSHRKTKPFAEYKSVKATEGQSAESVEATEDEENLAEDVTAIESNADEKPMNKPKSDKKIEDFGEKIGGARKDVARARLLDTVKLSAKDLESLKDPDKILSRKAIIKYMEEGQMTQNDGISLLVRKDTLFNEEEIPEEDYVKSAWPYPSARENEEIKPYFDHLFSTLEEKVDEQGNVILFRSAEPAPVFYSNAEYAVKAVKQEKATPEQWLKMIEKNGGLKAGEDKWLGLSDWLKSSDKKTLTKQEVLDFIKENQIQIEEVVYGSLEETPRFKELRNEYKSLLVENDYNNERTFEAMVNKYGEDFELAFEGWGNDLHINDYYGTEAADAFLDARDINGTRIQYTTDGLDNKREIALTVPTIESWNESDEIHFGDAGNGRAIAWVRFGETTIPIKEIKEVKEFQEPRKSEMTGREMYAPIGTTNSKDYVVYGKMRTGEMAYVVFIGERPVSKHNTLEEARSAMNEYYKEHKHYILAGKERVLVIDEVQSKRHQEGREKGYAKTEANDAFEAYRDQMMDKYGIEDIGSIYGVLNTEDKIEFDKLRTAANVEFRNSSDIPSAPFEKNWAELAMKRMLRYAAENGFDKIAWTTGEQQAERYDISKSVDNIKSEDNNVEETSDGTLIVKNITIYAGGSVHNLFVDANGIVRGREYDGKKLSDIVGKPLAEKLMEKGDFELEGDGLRIGGEGMKAFYDQMIPSFMNKYGKKWGVKVGEVTMPSLEENNTMHSIDVTDAMRESVMQGQPMFRTAKSNFDSQFAELQTEYDALDKNDTETLNSWRDKKADVVRSYVNWVSDKFGLKCELYVFNGGREEEMRKAYDTMVEKYKAEGIEKVPSYESFKKKVSNPKVVATYRKSINFVTFNTSAKDAELDIEQFAETLFHENAHRIAQGMYSKQEFEQIWENAKKSKNHIAKSVEKLYSDKSDAQKGNEFIAKAIGELVRNHKQLFTKFLMGKDDISAEDLVKKLKYSLPLGKLALTETLNKFKDEYQERVLQGSGSSLLGGSRDGGNIEVSEGDGGRNSRRNRQRESGRLRAERGRDVVETATNLASSLGVKLNVIEDVNEITDSNARRQRAKRGAKAWYDVNTDQVYFVAPNATSIADAQESVLHEVVAHKGLRDVVGRENFDKFLDKVFQSATPEIRSQIVRLAAQNGWDFRTATEEYLASLAEEGFDSRENRTFWQKVRDLFMDMLREAKIAIGYNITDNDMRYMLWRTYQKQKSQGAMAVAEDVLMQQKLGVGNFRTRPAGTRQMTEEEQIIADAKANGTYLKAPNGKKSNLTPKQWVQVRTKAFKKWFGDWEKAARIEKLRKSKDAEITGNEIEASEDLKEYRKNALEYGKTFRGEYVNKDTGEAIVINKDSLTEVLHHDGSNIAHIQSVAAIPQMVESGIYITSEPISETASKKMRNAKMAHYYVCGLKIGDIPYTVKFVVAEFESGEKYYDHSLTEIEKGELLNRAELSSTVADSKSPISDIKDKRLVSILQTNSSKIVDANGEPKVVYHRTPNKFTSFDVEKIGSSTDFGAFGNGFYFSPFVEQYRLYGKYKIAAFLNARNPFNLNEENVYDTKMAFGMSPEGQRGWTRTVSKEFTQWLKDNGYDAVVYKTDYNEEEDVVFNPNQIKSATDNVGTFDANNDDIRFRTAPNPADIEDGEVKGVREAFDKKVRSAWYQTKEAMYDNRQALKEYMRLATKAHGANLPNDDMKHIEAWENPYMAIMQKSSINQKEVESWEKKYYHPILNAIYKILDAAKKRDVGTLRGIFGTDSMDDILNNYLQGKHGLERNRDMAVRNALDEMTKATLITKKETEEMLEQVNTELQNDIITPTEADARRQQINNMLSTKKFTKEQVQAQAEVWKQRKDAIRKDNTLSWAEKQRALDKIATTEFGVDLAAKDYSGLGEVFPNEDGKLEQSIEDAYTAVEAFEELFDTKDLWDAIKAANNATIEKSFRSGIINKATMDSIRDMYDYYIPLRGFEAATTEDVYGYLNNEPRAFSMPVKRANGRASKAEFAIPHILQMAHSAILQGNNNLVKMKMANFAQHYPTDLIKQSNMYIEYDEVNDVWKAKYAEIPRDATPEEVDALIAEHNEKMAKAVKENPSKYRKVSGKMDVPYIIPKGMDSYHQIPYKRNGVDYVLTVNGDPRLAFVMNGELEKAATTFAGKAGEAVEGFTRYLSSMYTQYNPEFMLSNAFRDGTWVLATVPVRENAKYTAKFYKNYFKLIVPGVMQNLFVRYEKGTLDMSNDTHREFANFMQNGGETGYAILKDVENTKKRVSKDIHPSLWSKVMKLIDKLGVVGRGVESSARFAAYITSREEGRSITRSAYDAKEVSVNFNRKGAGAAFNDLPTQTLIGQIAGATAGTFKLTHTFFNAGMQGLAGVAKLVKYNPFKATTAFSSAFLLGMVVASLYDDDDEDYYNLTETVRRQNIIIRAGDQYVSIPLAIELRAMYGLGEMMVSMARGKEDLTKHNVAYKMADQILQAFPINILEGNGGIEALLPTAVALVEEVLVNEDWRGMPIYREDKYPSDEFNPEWQMVNNYTGRGYIAASKFLSEISGGDEGTRGVIEINPAVVQHIAEGILGGPLSFFDKTVATIDIARGKKDFEWRNIPFASRIMKDGGGKAQERANNREYYNNEKRYDAMHNSEKKYEKIVNDANRSEEDREKYRLLLEELKGSPEYEQLNAFHEASLKIDKMYRDAKKDNALDDAMPDINKKKEEANAILEK